MRRRSSVAGIRTRLWAGRSGGFESRLKGGLKIIMHATSAVNPVAEHAFSRIYTSRFGECVGSPQRIKIHHSNPSMKRSTKLSDNSNRTSSDTARCSRSWSGKNISSHHNVLSKKINTETHFFFFFFFFLVILIYLSFPCFLLLLSPLPPFNCIFI
jgi:hypothetical protein